MISRRYVSWRGRGAFLLSSLGVIVGLSVAIGCNDSSTNVNLAGLPNAKATLVQVKRGRALVISAGCADCHSGGKHDPASATWLAGYTPGTPGQPFDIGPFKTYPANLTPHATGMGTFTPRQLFNALRFGLDPEDAPDAVISSTTPGAGNFPAVPHYLAPPMPWPAYRHFSDEDLWAIISYLRFGLRPVNNTVPDSGGPPDFWAGSYTDAAIGPKTLPAYPATNELFNP